MNDSFQKVLWVAIPAFFGTSVTLFAGTSVELQVIAWGVLALIAAFGWWTVNARRHRHEREDAERKREEEREREEREWKEALMARLDRGDRADRVLLRNELVRMHREWVEERGEITLETLEYAENTYETYHELGGNGSGTKLWEDIRALPVKS